MCKLSIVNNLNAEFHFIFANGKLLTVPESRPTPAEIFHDFVFALSHWRQSPYRSSVSIIKISQSKVYSKFYDSFEWNGNWRANII